ncbi:hypothetical protein [Pelosinus sp. UFO1]|uniref:hypothetical protein n=1 Tax=Pelosinus sp. UFO1 TaxID=484770 RepID=UPI0004D0E019|nr:hypothetical protein [Pelosinus sp. UFO1]AIF50827.1 hypothetical protein UFO1_1272 [Pelosinus sp. UFO1]
MKKNRFVALMTILIGIIWICAPVVTVSAETEHSLQVEATSYIVSSQWLPAGDEAGHVIGMTQREGEAIFSNGETAKYSTVSTFDSRRSKGGTAQGYSKFAFDDGSLIVFSWISEIIRTQDGLPLNQGQGTIIKGTGRFEGIKGVSAFSGKQLKSVEDDTKLTSFQNATITYTLP